MRTSSLMRAQGSRSLFITCVEILKIKSRETLNTLAVQNNGQYNKHKSRVGIHLIGTRILMPILHSGVRRDKTERKSAGIFSPPFTVVIAHVNANLT